MPNIFVYIYIKNYYVFKINLLIFEIKRVLTASGMPIEIADQISYVDYKFIFMMDLFSQDILGNGILEDALNYIEKAVQEGVNVLVHW